jgi:hypothetical protein
MANRNRDHDRGDDYNRGTGSYWDSNMGHYQSDRNDRSRGRYQNDWNDRDGRNRYGRGYSSYGDDYGRGGDYDPGYSRGDQGGWRGGAYGRDYGDRNDGRGAGRSYSDDYGRRDYGRYDRDYASGPYNQDSDRWRDYNQGYNTQGYNPGYDWSYTAIWLEPGPHTGNGPQGYQRSNERIQEEANERLTQHGHLNASNVQVKADDGEVTLEGTVGSRRDKRMAEDAVDDISGVKDVHNHLRIDKNQNNNQTQQENQQQSRRR